MWIVNELGLYILSCVKSDVIIISLSPYCLLELYWTGFILLNGFNFLVVYSFFLLWVVRWTNMSQLPAFEPTLI